MYKIFISIYQFIVDMFHLSWAFENAHKFDSKSQNVNLYSWLFSK